MRTERPLRTGIPRIGISGWRYRGWRGVFYPPGLLQRDELEYAATEFKSIEINGSFYSLQRPEYFRRWAAAVPDDFVFAVKGSRFITHMKKLTDIEVPLANFFASGVLALGRKLGPFLWQLPPTLGFDATRLQAFFDLLPRHSAAAAAVARRHDRRLHGRAWTRTDRKRPLRHALEVRHASFCSPEFIELLRRNQIALVVADAAGRWPLLEDVTADFIYVRLHGAEELYASGYTPKALDHWAARVRCWLAGAEPDDARRAGAKPAPRLRSRDVFVYFDNDAKVHAPFDALALEARLLQRAPARMHPGQGGEPLRTEWPAMRRTRRAKA